MHGSPFDICQRGTAINRVSEDIEHPGADLFADGCHERSPGVRHGHASGESLSRSQGDPPDMTGVALRQHFDGDAAVDSRAEHAVDRRQVGLETDVDDTPSNRDNHAFGRRPGMTGLGWSAIKVRRARFHGKG